MSDMAGEPENIRGTCGWRHLRFEPQFFQELFDRAKSHSHTLSLALGTALAVYQHCLLEAARDSAGAPYGGALTNGGVAFVRHEVLAIVLGRCAPPRVLCGPAARSPDVPPVGSVQPLPSSHISSHCVIDR